MKDSTTAPPLSPEKSAPKFWTSATTLLVLLAVTAGFQWHSGAYRSDFGGHSDEPAHVVTGLMVRDYMAGGFLDEWHPLRFAQAYYDQFPKVALGHYPPGFYLVEGLWLLPFRTPAAVLVLCTLLSALAAWLTWRWARTVLPACSAALAAALFCLLPLVRTYTAIVMSDLLLTFFCLGAAMAFARFLKTPSARWSLAFGFLATAAILTKGAGLMLAVVPPASLLLTGKLRLLLDRRLWLAPLPVVLLAFPWMLFTRGITQEGMVEMGLAEFATHAAAFYSEALPHEFGYALPLLVLAALCFAAYQIFRRRWLDPDEAALWSLLAGLGAIVLLIPAGVDERYLLPAAPVFFILALRLLDRFSLASRFKQSPKWKFALVTIFGVIAAAETWRPVTKLFTGSDKVITRIVKDAPSPAGQNKTRVLVSSDATGEGALIAAAAFQAPDRVHILRGSKVLSSSDWLGRDYQDKFDDPMQVSEYIRGSEIDFVVIDDGIPKQQVLPYHRLMNEVAARRDGEESAVLLPVATEESLRKNRSPAHWKIYKTNP